MSQEEKNVPVEQQRLEKEQIEDMGSVYRTRGAHAIHCLTVIGQVEGHVEAPQGQKTTKYEHVIPQLVAVQEDPTIEGLLVLLNTVGGDVEAGLALAELIASGKVQVNWVDCTKSDRQLAEGDTVSARGFGKFRLTEVGGLTKKGRVAVTVRQFL